LTPFQGILEPLDACAQLALADAPGLTHVPSDLSVYLSVRTAKRTYGPATTLSWSRTGVYLGGNLSGGTLATILSAVDGSVPQADIVASQKSWALSSSAYQPCILMLDITNGMPSQGQEGAQALSLHPSFH
jgi:hypothetical protein